MKNYKTIVHLKCGSIIKFNTDNSGLYDEFKKYISSKKQEGTGFYSEYGESKAIFVFSEIAFIDCEEIKK